MRTAGREFYLHRNDQGLNSPQSRRHILQHDHMHNPEGTEIQ